MKTNSFDSHAIFRSIRGLTTAALAAIMLLVAPVAGFAQETTGSVRGTVLTPNMTPSAGEQVTVTDTRTGSSRTVTTNDAGSFNIRGLTIGGPYTIRVDSNSRMFIQTSPQRRLLRLRCKLPMQPSTRLS
jgi:hypothetical protein